VMISGPITRRSQVQNPAATRRPRKGPYLFPRLESRDPSCPVLAAQLDAAADPPTRYLPRHSAALDEMLSSPTTLGTSVVADVRWDAQACLDCAGSQRRPPAGA